MARNPLPLNHPIVQAAEAHTTLCMFALVQEIMEGSAIRGAAAQRAAERIVKICQDAQQMALRDFDRLAARALKREGPVDG